MKARARGLALAILYDHLGDKDRAIALSEPFMQRVIADLDNDWTLTGEEVEHAIKEAEIERAIADMQSTTGTSA